MSKAIAGAAMIVAAIGMGAILYLDPMLAFTPGYMAGMYALAAGGISMEAGALAEALTSNRGQNITTRMAAGLRQIVYGMQRIGGVTIYQSTTGANGASGNYVYNYIIVLAAHQIDSIVNLYLDGRQVFWSQVPSSEGDHANVGCGTVSTPPTATVTIAGGAITSITATGGAGFANVKPVDGYRVRIVDSGGGSGAVAWAKNTGSAASPVWTVTVVQGGSNYTSATFADIQGAYTFGGAAAADQQDSTQPGYGIGYGIGPGGPHYNFAGKVYCEARFGDQLPGDVITNLSNNDATWSPESGVGSPWVGGCAYIYLNVGYDAANFPSAPEVRLTINGKNTIYDPTSGK